MSARLAILEREGIRFGLVSVPAYHLACHRIPCFTPRELALLRQQAEAMGTPLPLPIEMVRALCAVKTAMPEGTIDDKIRDWPPSWQWLADPTQHKTSNLDVAPDGDPGGFS